MIEFIKDIIAWIFSLIRRAAEFLFAYFLQLGFFDKLLVLTIIPAFFAVIKPTARYYIFETWFYINNPLAENLIGIVFLIAVSFFIPPVFALILRVVPSTAYFIWVIYLQASHSISKAPYELVFWHYLNMLVPLLFAVFSLLSYLKSERGR